MKTGDTDHELIDETIMDTASKINASRNVYVTQHKWPVDTTAALHWRYHRCYACMHVQNVEFVRTGYGKNAVKVLYIRRQGSHHDVIELKADVELTLRSRKDYLLGDNSDVIPTDTIKNTVHALAKIKGVGHRSHTSTGKPVNQWIRCSLQVRRKTFLSWGNYLITVVT